MSADLKGAIAVCEPVGELIRVSLAPRLRA